MIDGAKDFNKEVQTLPNFFISRKKLGGTKTLYAQKPLKDVFADQNYYFNLNIPGVNLIKALTPVFFDWSEKAKQIVLAYKRHFLQLRLKSGLEYQLSQVRTPPSPILINSKIFKVFKKKHFLDVLLLKLRH